MMPGRLTEIGAGVLREGVLRGAETEGFWIWAEVAWEEEFKESLAKAASRAEAAQRQLEQLHWTFRDLRAEK